MKKNTFVPFAVRVINWLIPLRTRSLRVRLALWGLLLFGIMQFIVSAVLYAAISTWLEDQVNSTLRLTAAQVSSVIVDPNEPQVPVDIADVRLQFANSTNIATRSFLQEQLFFVRLIDVTDGTVLASSADYRIPPPQWQNQDATFETISFDDPGTSTPLRIYTLRVSYAPRYALQVGISLKEIRQIQSDVLRILLVLLLLTGTFAPLTGWFLASRALMPIRATARTAADINETDFSRRLDLASSEIELEQLVQTFNAMLDRIEEAFQRQRQFTADAAHELRTPLAIMQTHLDVTLSQTRSLAEYQTVLTSVREEVRRLSHLANALLMLARADARQLPLNVREFDLSLMVHTVIDQFEPVAQEKHLTLKRVVSPRVQLRGDEDRLIQVIVNLLDNAIKYTPEGGSVTVSARAVDLRAVICIENTGPGIPIEEQSYIFDRFYRTDSARNRNQGGFGLGLAIARRIVDLHHGTMHLVSQSGQGAQFVITLPGSSNQHASG